MTSVGAYERISEDPNDTRLGVARQREDTETLARLRRWTIKEHYTDNDVSAYKRGVIRPAFERLLADLNAGVIDGIVAYDLDRFARKPADLERAIELYDERPARVFATVQGDLDLSSGDGRTMARVMVAFANKSSMDTARRVTRKHLEMAHQGLPVGGGRPFGWQQDRLTLDPVESVMIQQAAHALLLGRPLHAICRDWKAAGILTPRGNEWRTGPVRLVLQSPRLAGYRVYRGKALEDEDGRLVRGVQEPVLDEQTWRQVCALLQGRAGPSGGLRGAPKYLLARIIRCAECGHLLRGNADRRWNTFSYCCPTPTAGGCGRVAINGPKTDLFIRDTLIAYAAGRRSAPAGAPWPHDDLLARLTDSRKDLYAAITSGHVEAAGAFTAVRDLDQKIAELRADLDQHLTAEIQRTPTDMAAEWDRDDDTDRRRLLVASQFESVMVRRAVSRGSRFDPRRIVPIPRPTRG